MNRLLNNLHRRVTASRPGSVLILVVALLVLMALIGTAFLSTQRNDRYTTVQHTNNTEIDLLLEGVKNMSVSTVVGGLNDPSLPFPYRPANSTIAKNWDIPDLFHQYTNDPLIGTTANDAWLSPRCPTDLPYTGTGSGPPIVVWPCLGEPLNGNTFESPFVFSSNAGNVSVSGAPLTYLDRVTYDFVPPPSGSTAAVSGNRLIPTFVTINYPDGTSATYPAFQLGVTLGGTTNNYYYLAGDADGDGIADCGMWKLPVGQINGLTYYAGVRIIDNSACVNVNTALSRRYDFSGTGLPTRYMTGTAPAVSTANYNGFFNLSDFQTNVGLAELLQTYDGLSTDNANGIQGSNIGLGSEFTAWTQYVLNYQIPSGVVTTKSPQTIAGTPYANPIDDFDNARADFFFTTLGDMYTSQIGRRPGNPGYVTQGYYAQTATDSDAAALAYHFVLDNPNAGRTPLELALHASLYDDAPNGPLVGNPANAPWRSYNNPVGLLPSAGSTSYVGTSNAGQNLAVVDGWYTDNFDWFDDFNLEGSTNPAPYPMAEWASTLTNSVTATAGQNDRCRRSIFTADSAASNLTPRPVLSAFTAAANGNITIAAGMTPITPTLCKASVNTAVFGDLWRAFWLAMSADNGLSPLGSNTGFTAGSGYQVKTANLYDHDLSTNQSIYTGSQFANPVVADRTATGADMSQKPSDFQTPSTDPQHPQGMFRSVLRNPTNAFYGSGNNYSYIEADQMVLLRSAIAAANVTAMRYPPVPAGIVPGPGNPPAIPTPPPIAPPIAAYDVPLVATIHGASASVWARVYGVTYQPYITEVYANTNTVASNDPTVSGYAPTAGSINTGPYVAVELYNPYNYAINLAGWQIAAVDRSPTSDIARAPTVLYTFPANDVTTGQPNIMPAYRSNVVTGTSTAEYQGSYALLENLGYGGTTYRPASTYLPPTGPLPAPTSGGPLIDVTVPTLGSIIAKYGSAPADAKQELVLLRPITGGTAAEATIDQVPVDSFDFTGLTWGNSDATKGPIADTWHYARGNTSNGTSSNSLWRFIYPGRYDATDPTPYASVPYGVAAPTPSMSGSGRTYPAYTYSAWSRRQQGTQAGRYYPQDSVGGPGGLNTQDPFVNGTLSPAVTLGGTASGTGAAGSGPSDNPVASYPVTFPFVYLNDEQPGASPLNVAPPAGSQANAFPFGQFARNSDLLQIPYVGSYIIFSAAPTGFQASGTGASSLTSSDLNNVIEINAMPMDCSFAEDTDLTDDPPNTDTQPTTGTSAYTWNESVGHFAPVNTNATDNATRLQTNTGLTNTNQTIADADPTLVFTNTSDPYAAYKVQYSTDLSNEKYWRYHWASRIFDYLTVQNPNDDYFPNVQQQIYSQMPASTPAGQIWGPQPLPVQNTTSITAANAAAVPASGNAGNGTVAISANPNAEDTVPVYGLINLNTAPWRVLSALRICPFDDAETDASGKSLAMQFSIVPNTQQVNVGNTDGVPDNIRLAQAIAYWRDHGPASGTTGFPNASTQLNTTSYPYAIYKGPFTSIADLLNVPAVQQYLTLLNFQKTSAEPNAIQGHLSPFDFYQDPPTETVATPPQLITDGVRNDTDERFDLLHRLSNMVTTKSDVYTVYIVIQGWRNAGSTNSSNPPQMVTQRRAAFIVDRTSVTPTNSTVKIINVPTN